MSNTQQNTQITVGPSWIKSTFHKWGSPRYFYRFASKSIPFLWIVTAILFTYGLIDGLVFAPPDYQQGDAFRIIYIHVPTAILSMVVFMTMAISSAIFLIWKMKLADIVAKESAPIGAALTFLALVTGSLWGKPMWGTYWLWDARLTSELILLFLYLGLMALRSSIPDKIKAAKATAILVIVGAIDVPIIHYSVNWWNSLHQGASLSLLKKPTIASSMLYPLLAMILAFLLYYIVVLFMRVRVEILQRERKSAWVKELT